jgi:hypothetical protein
MTDKLTTPPFAATLLIVLACAPCRGDDLFPPLWLPTAPEDRPPPRLGPPPEISFNPWAEWERAQRPPRTVKSAASGEWGSLTANSEVGDATAPLTWQDPQQPHGWKTDGSWRCPVAGPLFVFGQFGGAGTEVAQQDTKVAGQTGLGCKWSPIADSEFTVRGGPSVTYTDPLRPDRVQERSEVLLEVQARWPLLGKIGLEYQGKAAPALTPLDHDWLDQDVGLAAALGPGSKVRVGARRHWENVADPKPSPDNMQLYFGLELSR